MLMGRSCFLLHFPVRQLPDTGLLSLSPSATKALKLTCTGGCRTATEEWYLTGRHRSCRRIGDRTSPPPGQDSIFLAPCGDICLIGVSRVVLPTPSRPRQFNESENLRIFQHD